jgi:diguanylate cyclase (GGDEF)-like protein
MLGVASVAVVPLSVGGSYLVRVATAVTAVVLLLRQSHAPGRTSRAFLAGALLVGILSGLIATGYLLVTGEASPPGGLADWTYIAYGPLAVAGMLTLPRHPVSGPWRLKAGVEALIVVTSLAFLMERLGEGLARASGQPSGARLMALGYAVNAGYVLAVLLTVLPLLQAELRPFLRCAGLGLALMLVGDVGYGVGVLQGWYQPTTWPAAATQAGLFLVAVSVGFTRHEMTLQEDDPSEVSLLETAAPYISILPAICLSTTLVVLGKPFTQGEMGLAIVIGVALIGRQLLSNADHLRVVARMSEREKHAQAAALRDPLTELSNRTALHQELNRLLSGDEPQQVALALLDLDDFKDINDTHGHDTGDGVLREIAGRLVQTAPQDALVVRLGGDEFAVCATGVHPSDLGDALLALFEAPVVLGRRAFAITASVGVVVADPGTASSVALSHVDVAMYEAKAIKQPQQSAVVVLDGKARAQAAARVQLREDVSRPRLEEFRVVYEPLVDLTSGAIVGAEALLRWRHPLLGDVSPGTFIPLAEQVGGIHELGELALRTAVSDVAAWLADDGEALQDVVVGVNLSPRQLGAPGLVDLVCSVLEEHDVAPRHLVLEITEEALLEDWDTAIDVVHELRAIGIGVAVDDFGTGYSSMRYLRRFATSQIKIDREFVEAVAHEERTRVLVASVVDLAAELGLTTVAEGIETLDQLQVMRSLGCRLAQGYLFDRPMERDAFAGLLHEGHTYPVGPHLVPVPRSGRAEVSRTSVARD